MSTAKNSIIFALGAAVGSVVTYLVTSKIFEERLREEVDSVKESFRSASSTINLKFNKKLENLEELNETYKKILKDKGYEIKEGTEDDIPDMQGWSQYEVGKKKRDRKEPTFTDYHIPKVVRMATKEEEEQYTSEVNEAEREYEDIRESSEVLANRPVDNPPYLITVDEFEEVPEYSKLTVTYYSGDMTLVDDHEELMDIESTVGHDALDVLSEDNPCVYVRNDRFAIDYEICWLEAGFAEVNGVEAV